MSSRRDQRRGQSRNNEVAEHGEELDMWKDSREKLHSAINAFNESNQNIRDIVERDRLLAEKKAKGSRSNLVPLSLR